MSTLHLLAQTQGELLDDGLSQLAAILESGSDPESEEDEEDEEAALLQARDEAEEKLAEFEHASQALLAELSTLEAEYEIEKSCREQAEAFAMQVNLENKKLKRISGALLPLLGHLPEDLVDLGNREEITTEPAMDPVCQYLQQIKDLQAKVSRLLGEKKELAMQVKELQDHVQQLQGQLEEEKSQKQTLQASVEYSQRALKKVNQVFCLVTQEYGKVSEQLNLEEELRQQAEIFAHQMLLKQKEANRQSIILMQNVGPDVQLLHALDEVAKMTRDLEEAKQEHQAKVKDLEDQLGERPQPEELRMLQTALAMAEEEKESLGTQLLRTEERNAALEERVKSLEEEPKVTAGTPPPGECLSAPPPPPPPPLPPPTRSMPPDPLMAIRQRKGDRQVKRGDTRTDDIKARAVEEMIARIKSGVVLRPAGRDAGTVSKLPSAAVSKRRSTMMELQGLLSTIKRPVRKSIRRKGSQKKLTDNQLESILQRRRRIVDCPAETRVLQKQSAPATANNPPVEAGGAEVRRVHSAPEVELSGNPPASLQSSRDPSKGPPGDSDRPAAEAPLNLEKDWTAVCFGKRAASLQASRRIAATPGAYTDVEGSSLRVLPSPRAAWEGTGVKTSTILKQSSDPILPFSKSEFPLASQLKQ